MPRMHVVFGAYDGPIDAKPGEKVVFIGDCATFHGSVAGSPLQVNSLYVDRSQKNPHEAKNADIFVKFVTVTKKLRASRSAQVIRLEGCPVSVSRAGARPRPARGHQEPDPRPNGGPQLLELLPVVAHEDGDETGPRDPVPDRRPDAAGRRAADTESAARGPDSGARNAVAAAPLCVVEQVPGARIQHMKRADEIPTGAEVLSRAAGTGR